MRRIKNTNKKQPFRVSGCFCYLQNSWSHSYSSQEYNYSAFFNLFNCIVTIGVVNSVITIITFFSSVKVLTKIADKLSEAKVFTIIGELFYYQ